MNSPPASPATSSLDLWTVNKDQCSFFHSFTLLICVKDLFYFYILISFIFEKPYVPSPMILDLNIVKQFRLDNLFVLFVLKLPASTKLWMLNDKWSSVVDNLNVLLCSCKKWQTYVWQHLQAVILISFKKCAFWRR